MAAPVNFSLHMVSGRTLLKELIKEWAGLDLDKNSFESKSKNLISIIGSIVLPVLENKALVSYDYIYCVEYTE
jgi:hypothetical protein